jgi:D-alanine-D-alanine ligase
MRDRNGRIGVLLGGMSAERTISIQSGQAVARALRRRGWDTVEIDVGRDLPARLIEEKIDVCWIALHGRYGEDGCVQGVLEVMGIPYTGSGVLASAVAMDKHATKRAVRGLPGVVLAEDAVLLRGETAGEVALPVVVKPAIAGSTQGITIAHTRAELERGVEEAFALSDIVLLEAFVAGDEITVAVLDGTALPVVRIVPESGFFDFEAKYTKGRTRYEVPAPIAEAPARQAQEAAVAVYRALGCRGLCRADFIVRADGTPVFLEINTIPGMTETSLSPMAAGAVGMSFDDLVERVVPDRSISS